MDIAIFLAVALAPVIAVIVACGFFFWERRYQRRLEIFRAMMRSRRIWLSPDWAGSLNLVPVEFAGCEPVLAALDVLHTRYGDPAWQHSDLELRRRAVLDTENAACDLLLRMGEALHVGLRASDLRARPIAPFGWTIDEVQKRQTREMLAQVLSGARVLRVEPTQSLGMLAQKQALQTQQAQSAPGQGPAPFPWFEPSRANGFANGHGEANGHAQPTDLADANGHAAE
ncbi:MAG: DUF6680 family protein [Alphaproteobacteria bacterium]